MCGLFGHTIGKRKIDIMRSRKALNTLTHRGPDQWGEWNDENVYLGHRRLSILDLSENGRQPMVSGDVVITVNGEIWNFQDLRADLAGKYKFKSNSDSEVVLHGYIEWGLERLLSLLDGMYAITIYDGRKRKLFVARDRFGVKPLYYVLPGNSTDGRFVYASEAKALLEFCPDLRCFSREGVADWLLHRGSYSGLTPYRGVMKLLPGHYIEVDVESGACKISQYYELLDHVEEEGSNPADLDEILDYSVKRRLISDVPVGLQLSGGVDSSLVAAVMRHQNSGGAINSFSIGFREADETRYSEEAYARFVADKLGLQHHQINIGRDDIRDNFERVLWHADGMLDYPNTIPIYLLSKYSKPLVTVQMTGEGADELMGGYGKFPAMAALERSGPFPFPSAMIWLTGKIRPEWGRDMYLSRHYAGSGNKILDHLNSYIRKETIEKISGVGGGSLVDQVYNPGTDKRRKFDRLSFEKRLLLLDHKTYLHAVLERQDKASMGASIESRVPFLDKKLVEWSFKLPAGNLFDGQGTKKILKEKAEREFGRDFAYRRKMGFPMPVKSWMGSGNGLADFMHRTKQKDFIFYEGVNRYNPGSFDHVLLNYPDSEQQWVDWFMMVLRTAQDVYKITDIR